MFTLHNIENFENAYLELLPLYAYFMPTLCLLEVFPIFAMNCLHGLYGYNIYKIYSLSGWSLSGFSNIFSLPQFDGKPSSSELKASNKLKVNLQEHITCSKLLIWIRSYLSMCFDTIWLPGEFSLYLGGISTHLNTAPLNCHADDIKHYIAIELTSNSS